MRFRISPLRSLSLWLILIALPSASGEAATPGHFWSNRFGDAEYQWAYGIATDWIGNALVTGFFQGAVDFGGGSLASAGSTDAFLAKLDPAGNHVWSRRFGDAGLQNSNSVAVDGSGNIFITGQFGGTVNFGGTPLTSTAAYDMFLAKFDAAGNHMWSRSFGGANSQYGEAVAVDGMGNVLVTGEFESTVNFGGGLLTSAGSRDIFLVKFDPQGNHVWSRGFGNSTAQFSFGVASDSAGSAWITGYFAGSVAFGPDTLMSAGGDDIFIARFDAQGNHVWSRRFGDASPTQHGMSVATDGTGAALITGNFNGVVNFGGSNLGAGSNADIFLAKFDAQGSHVWSKDFGDANSQRGRGVACDAWGNVLLTGAFQGTVNFGGGPITSAGSDDIFLAKLTPGGSHLWSQRFGDAATVQSGKSVATNGSGSILISGELHGGADFGGGLVTSAGNFDVFVARFTELEPTIHDITDIGNDQGGEVRIRFAPSGRDQAGSPTPVVRYDAFRLDDVWIHVGTVPAFAAPEYNLNAPTLADSTISQGMHQTVFYIRAATGAPAVYFDSPPDSGYSLDNLAPPASSSLVYTAGTLSWEPVPVADFDHFAVYGSESSVLDGTAVQIATTTGTSRDVSSSPHQYYFVTAVDASGNEGEEVGVRSWIGVPDGTATPAFFLSAYPSPFRGASVIGYALPRSGRVSVRIYDARGAHVATLVNEERPAGSHAVRWEGRDDVGRTVESGVYFVKLELAGVTRAIKLVALE